MDIQLFSSICWKDCHFPLNYLDIFIENQLTLFEQFYLWTLFCNSIPIYFDDNNFVLKFNGTRSSTFFFFYRHLLIVLGFIHIYIQLRISLSISTKKPARNLVGIALNLEINLGRTVILTKLRFLIHEHGTYPHLFRF